MSSIRLNYLEPKQVKLRRREDALHLDVQIDGGEWIENVVFHRAFPLSKPREFLSLHDKDKKEIGVLTSIDGLDAESERLIVEEIDRRYFTPHISRINSLKQEAGMWRFEVETQRGPSDFFVRNWRDSAYEIVAGRWQITSVDGGRYEILNLEELDDKSQRLIEQLL